MSCLVFLYLPLKIDKGFFLRRLRRRLPLPLPLPVCLSSATTTTFGDAVPTVVRECCAGMVVQ